VDLGERGRGGYALDERLPEVCDDRPADNNMSVNARAWLSLFVVTIVIGLLLFVSAGTIHYWQAWVYVGIYFTASCLTVLYLVKRDPALLRRRMRGGPTKEKRKPQRAAMFLASLGFIAAMVVPALDHRFKWSSVPVYAVILGEFLTSLWFLVMFLVLRENTFSSATVQIAEGQTVISTGPYTIVRHPMYAGGLFSFIGTPLALGSWWGLLALVVVLPALTWRLLDEEKLLRESLPGYTAYAERVRYRLVPGVF
jgi:protein-S-isoprenylcysteine O-methyltransferase Ste14